MTTQNVPFRDVITDFDCVCVCMYVCIYVCVHVRMYVSPCVWLTLIVGS
jgi:hypothetical protein